MDNFEGRSSRSSRLVSHHFNDHSSPEHAHSCRRSAEFTHHYSVGFSSLNNSVPEPHPYDMSQAKEFGWRLLAAETIFHSYDSSMYGTPSVIRFDEPVNIREINILSPSMYMRTSSGEFLIGGTDPIKFPVTFHCNNVDEDTASANVKLGELNYEEDASMTFRCDNKIWTNRLIVFAKYSTLTIAVYGTSKNYNAKEHLKNLSPIQRMGAKYADGTYAFVPNYPSESKL